MTVPRGTSGSAAGRVRMAQERRSDAGAGPSTSDAPDGSGGRLAKLSEFTTDPRNANKGTERGRGLLEDSLRTYGAARSIVVDRHGVIIGGNKTHEVAADIGLDEAIVVPTDGRRLVVVQRTDLDLAHDPRAAELAVADNRVGQVDLSWDGAVIQDLIADGADLSKLFTTQELAQLIGVNTAPPVANQVNETFLVMVTCATEAEQTELLERFLAEGLTCKALVS